MRSLPGDGVGPAVDRGETVTASYAVPADNPILDASGNAAASLPDVAVANEPPVTAAARARAGRTTPAALPALSVADAQTSEGGRFPSR